jgi:glycosyltransferase involved in cell wall biosynthesis
VKDFDLFHVIDHSYSQLVHDLPAGAAVVTCHDLDTFRCVLEPERQERPLWFRLMTERILSGFRKAAHVIAVSSATRDEILRFGLHPASRVTVIPNGVHPAFTAVPDSAADAELSRLLAGRTGNAFEQSADGKSAIWLLNVGSSMRRKRLDLLLRVFAEVRKDVAGVRLLRVGEPMTLEHRELARDLNVESGIVELTSLSREVLAAVYRRADLLVHTADAEGFGLTLIEAMACGCPVIASDLPVLREVGADAATYRAVGDIDDWKQGIVDVLEKQRDLNQRTQQRENGFTRAAHFSWAENAANIVPVYQQLLGKEL